MASVPTSAAAHPSEKKKEETLEEKKKRILTKARAERKEKEKQAEPRPSGGGGSGATSSDKEEILALAKTLDDGTSCYHCGATCAAWHEGPHQRKEECIPKSCNALKAGGCGRKMCSKCTSPYKRQDKYEICFVCSRFAQPAKTEARRLADARAFHQERASHAQAEEKKSAKRQNKDADEKKTPKRQKKDDENEEEKEKASPVHTAEEKKNLGEKCATCKEPIDAEKHDNFVCKKCDRAWCGKEDHGRDDDWCQECIDEHGESCASCHDGVHPDKSVECALCNETLHGPSEELEDQCAISCSKCGMTICNECNGEDANALVWDEEEQDLICKKCAGKCDRCGKDSKLVECEGCEKWVCDHKRCSKTCRNCGRIACQTCISEGPDDGAVDAKTGAWDCRDCVKEEKTKGKKKSQIVKCGRCGEANKPDVWDSVTRKLICKKCVHKCDRCGKDGKPLELVECEKCEKWLCDSKRCNNVCHDCGMLACKSHEGKSTASGLWECAGCIKKPAKKPEVIKCGFCGRTVEHKDDLTKCPECPKMCCPDDRRLCAASHLPARPSPAAAAASAATASEASSA